MDRSQLIEASDADLLSAFQKGGDQEVLGHLYNRYMSLIYGLCLKYFKDQSKARDAVIDIYELLSRKVSDHKIQAWKPWLYMVARNHCLQRLRSDQRHFTKEKEAYRMYSEAVYHPDTDTREADLTKLDMCIDQLQGHQRTCVQMFYLDQLSYQDITQATDMTWAQVRSSIQNGRRNLKNCMGK